MYNDSIDKIFLSLKQQNMPLSAWEFPPKKIYSLYGCYMIWDQKEEMERKFLYINRWNKGVENKTGILYNDIVDQSKGM